MRAWRVNPIWPLALSGAEDKDVRPAPRGIAALKLLRRRLVQAVPLMLGVSCINFC